MHLLGEMTAAGALMQSNIKFNGALILQIFGDGPVKLAVAEVQPDLSLRATATVTGEVAAGSSLSQLVNVNNEGRCAITLDPKDKFPGQQPYQGVVPLFGDQHEKIEKLSEVLEHYMLQSEQLDTRLVLAADGNVAAGLLIQRLPVKGQGNLEGQMDRQANEDQIGVNEDYQRIATAGRHAQARGAADAGCRHDLAPAVLGGAACTRFEPLAPRFACSCSRERVGNMLRGLGTAEIESIIAERGKVDVACEFCGAQYRLRSGRCGADFHPPDPAAAADFNGSVNGSVLGCMWRPSEPPVPPSVRPGGRAGPAGRSAACVRSRGRCICRTSRPRDGFCLPGCRRAECFCP